ncbi:MULTISPECIES: lysoplasmalogenase [unclassified Nocardioides]|uniref:lysoplasmalogenase n=1 Tax=unclassified Nocardioides TaxID=2615069 RepID=UPI003606735B
MTQPRTRAVLGAYAAVGIVQVTAVGVDADVLAGALQVLLMPVLAGALLVERPAERSRLVRLTAAALGASWLGDSAPRLLDGDAAFIVMVAFFLVAQGCYIAAFRPYRDESILRGRPGWLAAYVVVTLALVGACLPEAGGLAPAVVVYGAALGTMAVLATGVHPLAWVGGAFFLVSDGLIAIEAFSSLELPAHSVWVMATYVVAQGLLVLGVIRRDEREVPRGSPASSARGSSAAADPSGATQPPATPAR